MEEHSLSTVLPLDDVQNRTDTAWFLEAGTRCFQKDND